VALTYAIDDQACGGSSQPPQPPPPPSFNGAPDQWGRPAYHPRPRRAGFDGGAALPL